MEPTTYRPEPRVASRLPMLIGVLIALALLWYLPSYLEQIEYKKMRGQVQAVSEGLPAIAPKLEALSKALG